MEMEKRLYPDKEIVPAGIFYCRLQDPLVEADSELTPAEIDHMLLKKMRPDGLVNLDPDVISRLDGRLEKTSLVIPVGVKKDGTCTAASSVAPLWQIEELSRFVSGKLEEFGRQILDGQIQAKPCRKRQETACDYCAFSHLCGFDPARERPTGNRPECPGRRSGRKLKKKNRGENHDFTTEQIVHQRL